MIWLAVLWPLSWLLVFGWRANACWQAAKKMQQVRLEVLQYGLRGVGWTILKTCLQVDRSDAPVFLLGPIGLLSVWLARRPA